MKVGTGNDLSTTCGSPAAHHHPFVPAVYTGLVLLVQTTTEDDLMHVLLPACLPAAQSICPTVLQALLHQLSWYLILSPTIASHQPTNIRDGWWVDGWIGNTFSLGSIVS